MVDTFIVSLKFLLIHEITMLLSYFLRHSSAVDTLNGSIAFGNERRSLFVNGQYEFHGISDYELLRYDGEV